MEEWSDGESFDGLGSDIEPLSGHRHPAKYHLRDFAFGLKALEYCLMKRASDNTKTARDDRDLTVGTFAFIRQPS